jgi:outer membrane protein assembly factor BamB
MEWWFPATWPDRLSGDALQQLWRVELGPSYSGPIVGGGKVFTTATEDRKWEVVRAFDLTSGKQLWETRWEGSMTVPFFAATNGSWIRATPALDEGRCTWAGCGTCWYVWMRRAATWFGRSISSNN